MSPPHAVRDPTSTLVQLELKTTHEGEAKANLSGKLIPKPNGFWSFKSDQGSLIVVKTAKAV